MTIYFQKEYTRLCGFFIPWVIIVEPSIYAVKLVLKVHAFLLYIISVFYRNILYGGGGGEACKGKLIFRYHFYVKAIRLQVRIFIRVRSSNLDIEESPSAEHETCPWNLGKTNTIYKSDTLHDNFKWKEFKHLCERSMSNLVCRFVFKHLLVAYVIQLVVK